METTPLHWNLVPSHYIPSCYAIACLSPVPSHWSASCWNHLGIIALEPSWRHWVGARCHHVGTPSCWNHLGTITLKPSWRHWVGARCHHTGTPIIPSCFFFNVLCLFLCFFHFFLFTSSFVSL
jgi:hypothetical protein